uniref:Putative Flagellar M-ring protein FliF n=1 Tax=mine drainage metagenome TaxID=410659 RepID=E6QMC3_9ZZZZ
MGVGGLLAAAVLAAVVWFATRTDWRTLYAGLDPDDSRQMAQVLTQAQIPFDLSVSGTTIRVAVGDLDKARLATAAKGGPHSGRMGFELFDKPNWVGSEFDEKVNYQRALEGELEHTIATLNDVQSARVHLVLPHDSLFRDQDRPAKASVVLSLRHGRLADGEDDAIRNLVASAVDGLTASEVVLVDASGHLPLGPKTGEQMRLGTEEALESKLIETLEPVTGAGNVRASVTVDYDPKTTEETDESYDPNQTVTLSMQRTEQTAGPQPIPAGVPGTASNAPNAQSQPVYPPQSTPPQSAKTESGTYAASHKVVHMLEQPGHMRRVTAAIVVNDRLVTPATRGRAAVWQPRSAAELSNLTALAQASVGYDQTRGDLVTVEDMSFEDNRGTPPVSMPSQMLAAAEESPMLVKYGTLLTALLLLILLGVRPALKEPKTAARGVKALGTGKAGQAAGVSGLAGAGVAAALPVAEPTEADLERLRVQQVFDQVTEHLKRDPAQSSRLLQSWIHSD